MCDRGAIDQLRAPSNFQRILTHRRHQSRISSSHNLFTCVQGVDLSEVLCEIEYENEVEECIGDRLRVDSERR
jgi:hypothetical protein